MPASISSVTVMVSSARVVVRRALPSSLRFMEKVLPFSSVSSTWSHSVSWASASKRSPSPAPATAIALRPVLAVLANEIVAGVEGESPRFIA